jgi:hypothetical protein
MTRALVESVFKRGTAAQWSALNPVLLDGMPGWERDTGLFKIGDGVTAWNTLAYYSGSIPTPGTTDVVTKLEVDSTGGDQAVNLITYTNVAIFKKDASANVVTISDSTPRNTPDIKLTTQGDSVHLVLLNGTWYVM